MTIFVGFTIAIIVSHGESLAIVRSAFPNCSKVNKRTDTKKITS